MKKISSTMTTTFKIGFPLLWFGFLASFLVGGFLADDPMKNLHMIIGAPIMAVFGYAVMKKGLWNLADEVLDGGDFLVIKQRGHEDRLPLSNIMNVSASSGMYPEKVTLRLVEPGRFGSEVGFLTQRPLMSNPFANNPVAEDLIVRVDKARDRRRA